MLLFQATGRVVTASQQKAAKTVTTRITARPDVGKTAHSNLQVMSVAPPMSSVIVERHHPVTKVGGGGLWHHFQNVLYSVCYYVSISEQNKNKFLRFFSSPLVRPWLQSSLAPPNRHMAPQEGGAPPNRLPTHAKYIPSKWLTDHSHPP